MSTNSLSPAAQAVLDAFVDAAYGSTFEMRQGIAAALRAALDEVIPLEYELVDGYLQYEKQNSVRDQFLTIIAELENGNG